MGKASSRCWFCKDECKDTPLEEDKKKRTLTCTRCKRTLDRDLHASYNILEVAAQYALDGDGVAAASAAPGVSTPSRRPAAFGH